MKQAFFLTAMLAVVSGCTDGQPQIDWGRAECAHCRMNVMDRQFGSALVTSKGRQYSFDGPECMVRFVLVGEGATMEVKAYHVADHAHPGTLIDATTAFYVHGGDLHSPMGGNAAAFASQADRDLHLKDHGGEALDWAGVKELFSRN